jgi:hypothetical protein
MARQEANFAIGVMISIGTAVYLAVRTRAYWLSRVTRCYGAVVTYRQHITGLLGLIVVLLGIGYAWRVLGDENAPHCSPVALQDKRCQAGDWLAVPIEGAALFCDFNKKLYTLDRGVICRYAGARLSR